MTETDVEKVRRALKAAQEVNQLLSISRQRGRLFSGWMVNAGALADGLLALAAAARAATKMVFPCSCGAVPFSLMMLHKLECPLGILDGMLKEP